MSLKCQLDFDRLTVHPSTAHITRRPPPPLCAGLPFKLWLGASAVSERTALPPNWLPVTVEGKWSEATLTARLKATWTTMLTWRRRVATKMGTFTLEKKERFVFIRGLWLCHFSVCWYVLLPYEFVAVLPFSQLDSHGSMSPSTTTQVQARKRRRGVSELITSGTVQ